jgi:hypothetical protein
MKIYFLAEPLAKPLIHVPGVKQVTDSQELTELRDSLYVRTDVGFRFVAEQSFDPGKIDVDGSTGVE